jgi:tetratricopeptide (TPR) repeat protein
MTPSPLRLPAHVLLLALALCIPARAAAQEADAPSVPTGDELSGLLRASDEAHERADLTGALSLLEDALAASPDAYAALWRAARETVNLGMLASSGDEAKGWYRKAEGYARRAHQANPRGVEAGEWLAIALGRAALHEGPRSRVHMAVEIRDVALATLALDSTNAGAHHVLGEWNAQIRRLSGIERWMAKNLLGGSVFDEASWEAAEHHLLLAIRYDPDGLLHYLDLARVYRDLDRKEDAARLLEELLAKPAVAPTDALTREDAEAFRRELGG